MKWIIKFQIYNKYQKIWEYKEQCFNNIKDLKEFVHPIFSTLKIIEVLRIQELTDSFVREITYEKTIDNN